VNLNSIVEEVLSSYQSQMNHLGFSVQTGITTPLPDIMADRDSVSEAVLNVIDNALKFGSDKKWIRISTGSTEREVYVEVEDHGIGIAAQDQSKIFEKFFRVSSGLVHETRGSGLGLTLVQHIMDAHKGSVTVKSQPGEGSTFRLSFPLAAS
jgi:two-component system, OmpR family, phosphate regulon sensor histidine kinase PhoR